MAEQEEAAAPAAEEAAPAAEEAAPAAEEAAPAAEEAAPAAEEAAPAAEEAAPAAPAAEAAPETAGIGSDDVGTGLPDSDGSIPGGEPPESTSAADVPAPGMADATDEGDTPSEGVPVANDPPPTVDPDNPSFLPDSSFDPTSVWYNPFHHNPGGAGSGAQPPYTHSGATEPYEDGSSDALPPHFPYYEFDKTPQFPPPYFPESNPLPPIWKSVSPGADPIILEGKAKHDHPNVVRPQAPLPPEHGVPTSMVSFHTPIPPYPYEEPFPGNAEQYNPFNIEDIMDPIQAASAAPPASFDWGAYSPLDAGYWNAPPVTPPQHHGYLTPQWTKANLIPPLQEPIVHPHAPFVVPYAHPYYHHPYAYNYHHGFYDGYAGVGYNHPWHHHGHPFHPWYHHHPLSFLQQESVPIDEAEEGVGEDTSEETEENPDFGPGQPVGGGVSETEGEVEEEGVPEAGEEETVAEEEEQPETEEEEQPETEEEEQPETEGVDGSEDDEGIDNHHHHFWYPHAYHPALHSWLHHGYYPPQYNPLWDPHHPFNQYPAHDDSLLHPYNYWHYFWNGGSVHPLDVSHPLHPLNNPYYNWGMVHPMDVLHPWHPLNNPNDPYHLYHPLHPYNLANYYDHALDPYGIHPADVANPWHPINNPMLNPLHPMNNPWSNPWHPMNDPITNPFHPMNPLNSPWYDPGHPWNDPYHPMHPFHHPVSNPYWWLHPYFRPYGPYSFMTAPWFHALHPAHPLSPYHPNWWYAWHRLHGGPTDPVNDPFHPLNPNNPWNPLHNPYHPLNDPLDFHNPADDPLETEPSDAKEGETTTTVSAVKDAVKADEPEAEVLNKKWADPVQGEPLLVQPQYGPAVVYHPPVVVHHQPIVEVTPQKPKAEVVAVAMPQQSSFNVTIENKEAQPPIVPHTDRSASDWDYDHCKCTPEGKCCTQNVCMVTPSCTVPVAASAEPERPLYVGETPTFEPVSDTMPDYNEPLERV
eukprot:TRINITY_DN78_c0_g1_i1.p1 TRINITY_DN78_c0_g1~~TRINITY_DN78_c0_g1_i1.p1  ORF type:complete len:1067 (+),score=243.01 TRINITY_DN78_c0_g1_i1:281-3202(+)